MGWHDSDVIITLPAGATSGARIVINGIDGTITMYNTANEVTGVWSASGQLFELLDPPTKAGLATTADPSVESPRIFLNADDVHTTDSKIVAVPVGDFEAALHILTGHGFAPGSSLSYTAGLELFSGSIDSGTFPSVSVNNLVTPSVSRQKGEVLANGPALPSFTFQAGMSNFNTLAGGQGASVAVRWLTNDRVELIGAVGKGTGAGGVVANGFVTNDPILVLDADYRPSDVYNFPCATQARGGNTGAGRVQVSSSGFVRFFDNLGSLPGWLDFGSIQWTI